MLHFIDKFAPSITLYKYQLQKLLTQFAQEFEMCNQKER